MWLRQNEGADEASGGCIVWAWRTVIRMLSWCSCVRRLISYSVYASPSDAAEGFTTLVMLMLLRYLSHKQLARSG